MNLLNKFCSPKIRCTYSLEFQRKIIIVIVKHIFINRQQTRIDLDENKGTSQVKQILN